MCPECYATIALLVTGALSTGGVAAVAVKMFRGKKTVAKVLKVRNTKEKAS